MWHCDEDPRSRIEIPTGPVAPSTKEMRRVEEEEGLESIQLDVVDNSSINRQGEDSGLIDT